MAVPILPLDASLDDLLQENAFTLGKLQTHPLAVPFTSQFDALHTDWVTTATARTALQITLGKADGAVSSADDTLDDFVDTLDRTLLIAVKNDRKNPLYTLYFGDHPPNVLKRPVLGPELETVRKWVSSLTASPVASLAALASTLSSAVTAADAAVTAKAAAQQALDDFDATGGKAQHIGKTNATRQTIYGQLAAIPHATPTAALPTSFGDRFFRHNQRAGVAALKTVTDAQAEVAKHQKKLTAAQNHLANLTTAETARAAAKTAATSSEAAATTAKKSAKEATTAAKAAAKKAQEDKVKARKHR